MRDVDQITTQTPDDGSELKVAFGRSLRLEQRNGVKVGREASDFSNFLRGADQEILILPIQPAKSPNNIPGVRPYAEIRHAPDINADFHDVI
jgi:hypothetical protein